jgi:endonuclease YncB( thermonuclease family)
MHPAAEIFLLSSSTAVPTNTLSEKKFAALVRELGRLLTTANEAASSEKARGYWQVGQRITKERLTEEAGYHNSVLGDLARGLSISARTLQRSVAFHAAYPKPPSDGLSWMHYQILSALDDKSERDFYQKQTLQNSWTVRALGDAIRADLFGGGTIEARVLERPTSLTYCFIARLEGLIDADTFDFDVDLGFSTWTKRRIRLAGVNAPEITNKEGRAARNFVAKELARAKTIVIKSQKSDLYGRYLGHLFLAPESVSLEACFQNGRYLNDLLLRNKHAVVV